MSTTDGKPSSTIETINPERAVDVEQKQRASAEFLAERNCDALLLERPANLSWFTSGADITRNGLSDTTAALFITPESRVVVTNNVDSVHLFDNELNGLGFQLKERAWHEPREALLEDLCRGRKVVSDSGFGATENVSADLARLRLPLSALECERLRALAHQVGHAVEATARQMRQRQSEAEIAGEVAHRMIKGRVVPERVQVAADGSMERYRHWSYGAVRVERWCTISAIGRRWGLTAGVSRTMCFGTPPDDVLKQHHRAMLIQAVGLHFSQPELSLADVWQRVERIYEKLDLTNEWPRSDQAEVTGYQACEQPMVPGSEFVLSPRMPLYWHPSIGPCMTGDTVLVGEEGHELLTPMEVWPKVTVKVKGETLSRPDILRREMSSSPPVVSHSSSGDTILQSSLEESVLE